MVSWIISNPFLAAALACAVGAAVLALWFLVRRPGLTRATKLVLLAAIGILPLATAGTGNVAVPQVRRGRRLPHRLTVARPAPDAACRWRQALATERCDQGRRGSDTWKRVPCGEESNVTVPLCAATIPWTIERPSPVPPSLVVKNGS